MQPFDERIIGEIKVLVRRTGKPASSLALATRLGVPQSSMQYYLRRLEREKIVCRPLGKRNGYAVNRHDAMMEGDKWNTVVITKNGSSGLTGYVSAIDHHKDSPYYVVADGEPTGTWLKARHFRYIEPRLSAFAVLDEVERVVSGLQSPGVCPVSALDMLESVASAMRRLHELMSAYRESQRYC